MIKFKCPSCNKSTISYKMKSKSIEEKWVECSQCEQRLHIKRKYFMIYLMFVAVLGGIIAVEIPYKSAEYFIFFIFLAIFAMYAYVFILPLSKKID